MACAVVMPVLAVLAVIAEVMAGANDNVLVSPDTVLIIWLVVPAITVVPLVLGNVTVDSTVVPSSRFRFTESVIDNPSAPPPPPAGVTKFPC